MDLTLFTEIVVPTFATLFVIIDPPGLLPMFLGLTAGASEHERRVVAVRACVVAAGVLVVFALFGDQVLGFLGIGMPAFRIAGGLMLFLIAVEMLFEKRSERRSKAVEQSQTQGADRAHPADEVAVFPLAVPLIAGPGAIASIILLMSSHRGNPLEQAVVVAVMLAAVAVTLVLFLMAHQVERLTGTTFITVVTRIFGIILGALAVQFVLSGLVALGIIAHS
jgi:multiple antibiotic resistance protein